MGRFKHVGDVRTNEDGILEYTGEYYRFGGEGETKKALTELTACVLILLALTLVSGCLDAKSATGSYTVIIPFIGEVSCVFVIVWQSVRLLTGKGTVRVYVMESIRSKIPAALKILTVFCAVGLCFSVIYIVRNGMGQDGIKSLVYPVMKGVIAVTAVFTDRRFAGVLWSGVTER